MSILEQLSSQTGKRSEQPNRKVAELCIGQKALLNEIAKGFKSKDNKLVGDGAEVMTFVAETNPKLVSKYINELFPLIRNRNGRVKWEAMHAISLITPLNTGFIFSILNELDEIIHKEEGVIVRDYAVQTICNYAKTSKKAATIAFPFLKEILNYWGERHASRVIECLADIISLAPGLKTELISIVKDFENNERGIIKKAVNKLNKGLRGIRK